MLTIESIQAASLEAAAIAASEKRTPLVVWEQDVETLTAFERFCGHIPNLGSYIPPGWTAVFVDDLAAYPYKWFFVDSLGLGREDEPALTIEGFRRLLQTICDKHGYRYGVAIVEVGEFQVQIALFLPPDAGLPKRHANY